MRDRIGVADEERAPPGVIGSFQYRVNAVALVVAYFVVALLVRYADAPALQPSFGLFVDGSTLLQPPLGLSLIKRRQSQWPSLGLMLIEPPQAHQQFTLELGSAFPLSPTVSVPRTRIRHRSCFLVRFGVRRQADRERRGLRHVGALGREPHAPIVQCCARD